MEMLEVLVEMFEMFKSNMVNIPLIQPVIDALMNIPIVNYIVALVLWKPFFAIAILPGLGGIMIVLLLMVYWERKLTARIQWRVGPLEVFRPLRGLIQPLADGFRYFFQEVIVHVDSHRPYFVQLPILTFIPVLLPILFIPAGEIVAIRSSYAIQIIVALIALIPITIIAIGWASNSRFAYIGSVREAMMYFAYEVPFVIAVLAMILMYGSGDPYVIVEKQSVPGVIMNPIAFLVFFIATLMATSRLPFEIPEADQEIAFGPFVEYSGILFGIVMTLAYEKLYIMCLLMSILFFGGWNGISIPLLGDLSPAIWLFVKAVVVMLIVALARSIYPRFRLDQALKLGWTSMLLISLVSLALAIVIRLSGWLG